MKGKDERRGDEMGRERRGRKGQQGKEGRKRGKEQRGNEKGMKEEGKGRDGKKEGRRVAEKKGREGRYEGRRGEKGRMRRKEKNMEEEELKHFLSPQGLRIQRRLLRERLYVRRACCSCLRLRSGRECLRLQRKSIAATERAAMGASLTKTTAYNWADFGFMRGVWGDDVADDWDDADHKQHFSERVQEKGDTHDGATRSHPLY
ncbi:hypothetical protein B0H19DRAFT_1140326 [Mycena capillaripes]|nr:hypothetical protein B0H19DRAFT_1140326 [Mycena capillaripes]